MSCVASRLISSHVSSRESLSPVTSSRLVSVGVSHHLLSSRLSGRESSSRLVSPYGMRQDEMYAAVM